MIPLSALDPGPRYRVKMLPIVPGHYAPTPSAKSTGARQGAVAKVLARETGASATRIEGMFEAKAALKAEGILVTNLPFYFAATKEFEDGSPRPAARSRIPAEPGERNLPGDAAGSRRGAGAASTLIRTAR